MRPGLLVCACAALGCTALPTWDANHDGAVNARPDSASADAMFRYDAGSTVLHLDSASGHFRIHYVTTGRHAVRAADLNSNSVPDDVEAVAATYDDVFGFYGATLGFREPLRDGTQGGDDRFDVYLVDFALSADGAFRAETCGVGAFHDHQCAGFMVQENDFAGYHYASFEEGVRTLASHEFFHAVQAAYHADMGNVMGEGTAVWATEQYDPTLDDLEGFLPGFVENLSRSLDKPLPGPVDPFSYGAALFFQFLHESNDPHVVRALYEQADALAAAGQQAVFLDVVSRVAASRDATFAMWFLDFADWNARMDTYAQPDDSYDDGADYPDVPALEAQLPGVLEPTRLFYASAQYFAADSAPQAHTWNVVLRPQDGAEASAEVWLLAWARTRTSVTDLARLPMNMAQDIAVPANAQLLLSVVNTAAAGSSQRVELCVDEPGGTLCAPAAPDAGVDAGQEPAATPAAQDEPDAPWGCSQTAAPLWALVPLVAAARRRVRP